MEINRLRSIIDRYWWIVAAGAIIIATAVLVYNLSTPPKYAAEMSMIIVPRSGSVDTDSDPLRGVEALDRRSIAETLGEVARSHSVIERADAAVDFDLETMLQNERLERDVVVLPSTNVIRIQIEGENPAHVALAADAIGRAAQAQAAELRYPYSLEVLDAVEVPTQPVESNLMADTILGLVVGAFTGFGFALALDYLRQPQVESRVTGAVS